MIIRMNVFLVRSAPAGRYGSWHLSAIGRRLFPHVVAVSVVAGLGGWAAAATKITFDQSGVMAIDGSKIFPISFSMGPPADGGTPEGKEAYAELKDAGANYLRVAPPKASGKWNEAAFMGVDKCLDAAARNGMYCWITLRDLGMFKQGDDARGKALRAVVEHYRDHPANGGYKTVDEPAWGKVKVEAMELPFRVIRELDPHHPVFVLHAPEHIGLPLEPYAAVCDITGADIYPIAYPPGYHSDFGNRELSCVSDVTQWVKKANPGKSIWMVLQIAWSGVAASGHTLRFPTLAEERYLTYAAIINGARGINYFGGDLHETLADEDKPLGWNWRFWKRVLRPLIEEIGEKSPLYPALVAPGSSLPVKVAEDPVQFRGAMWPGTPPRAIEKLGLEFCVREVGSEIFLLAAKREGLTAHVKFSGLGKVAEDAEVMYEPPRKVKVKDGAFTDWFGPNEVHVYRLKKKQ
jgi:hypothetical protein